MDEEGSDVFEDRAVMQTVLRVGDVCRASGLGLSDQAIALELAWMVIAQELRGRAGPNRGEFQKERSRQMARLHNMAMLLWSDGPDIELERMQCEGTSAEAVLERLRRKAEAD